MEERLVKRVVNWIYKNPNNVSKIQTKQMIVALGIVFLEIAIVVVTLLFVNFVMV